MFLRMKVRDRAIGWDSCNGFIQYIDSWKGLNIDGTFREEAIDIFISLADSVGKTSQ